MEERLIQEILIAKENSVRNLLNCTESPIERIFLLELLNVLEDSISNPKHNNGFPNIKIDGYTFLPQVREQGQEFIFTNQYCGIEIKYTDLSERIDPAHSKQFRKDGTPTKRRVKKINVSQDTSMVYQTLSFIPQYKVQIGGKSYRLDFAFILREYDNEIVTTVRQVGIECDGYKYHSSPEKFSNDRTRNRALNCEDWIIIQYSGAEIYSGNIDFKKEFAKIFSVLGFSEFGFHGEFSGYKLNIDTPPDSLPF